MSPCVNSSPYSRPCGGSRLVLIFKPFENQGVDAGVMQQLAEQQAGGAGADDGDLGLHCCCHCYVLGGTGAMDWQPV